MTTDMKCEECKKETIVIIYFRLSKICDECYYKKDVMERIEHRLASIADILNEKE